jgi:hypothetical protein
MRSRTFLVAAMLASASAFAWQLQSRTLAERADDADVIVVGSVAAVHSRTQSPFAGMGDVWSVNLSVSRTLKGSFPAEARVSFTDVGVQDRPAFAPSETRVWLLKKPSDPNFLTAPASCECVLIASEEAQVRSLMPPGASPSGARP